MFPNSRTKIKRFVKKQPNTSIIKLIKNIIPKEKTQTNKQPYQEYPFRLVSNSLYATMEEEGTEIILRPGTDANLLQYCITEPSDGVKLNGEVLSSTRSKSDEDEEISSTHPPSSPSIEEEERQEPSTNRAFFPEPAQQEPSHPDVNRHDSLMEDDIIDEDNVSVLSTRDESIERNDENYHPALKAAVYTEGQEAVWHEDEYSTISSVYYVKPEKNQMEMLPSRSQNLRNKMKVPFFKSRGKKAQKAEPISEEVEPTLRPVKIHIKKKKVAKAVVLLPPKELEAATKEKNGDDDIIDCKNLKLINENNKYASITENSSQARRLLETALSGDGLDEEESERLTKEAFNHATVARRLASDLTDDDEYDEEAIELENTMSHLAEEGEQAALQHRRQNNVDEENDGLNNQNKDKHEGEGYSNAIDLTMMDADESAPSKKKRQGKFPVSEYATRAVHYLESILPKNMGNEKGGSGDAKPDDASISTLGLKNDTLEYGLDTDEGNDEPNKTLNDDGAALPRRVTDMMSLSSLNEILDGSGTVTDKKCQIEKYAVLNEEVKLQKQPFSEPSLRATVQEIGIPKKNNNSELPKTRPRQNRSGILGLLTPKIPKQSKEKEKVDDADDNINYKNWGIFFKTPRGNEGVPSQLNLVLDEPNEDKSEVPKREEVSSSTSLDSIKVNTLEAEKVEGDSDSYLDMPESNRYDPAFDDDVSKSGRADRHRTIVQDDEIELKLSVATEEDKNSKNAYVDDDTLLEDFVKPESPSLEEEVCETSEQNEEARIDLSPANDDKSENDVNQDRYQTEPVGMTPRRDGGAFEENTNRKFGVDENEIKEEQISSTVTKEETDDEKLETMAKAKETSINEDQPDSESSIQSELKPSTTDKREEVVTMVDAEKDIVQGEKRSDTAQAEASNSKIFDRVVGKIGQNKRKPLVPNSVLEEKYLVDKAMKKISTREQQTRKSRKVPTSKITVAQRAISKMKDNPTSSSYTVINDSATVVQKAISNGNLKANESNEEGDDVVPLNYLSAMLKTKLYEQNVNIHYSDDATNMGEPNQQRSSGDKQDEDSYVAAIRGPRPKEAPGVALEEVAIRNHNNSRDPSTGNGIDTVFVDLAPTPRRPKGTAYMFDDEGEEAVGRTRNIAMKEEEEERQRRNLITERLFKAGRSSFNDEAMSRKSSSEGVIKTAPTVASAESYCDEPVQENMEQLDESDSNKEIIEKIDSHSRTKLSRGRRRLTMSFLKGGKRK